MTEKFISDKEYQSYFSKLNGLRARITGDLPINPDMRILDIASGYGYFTLELVRYESTLKIIGIDIAKSDIKSAVKYVRETGHSDKIKFIQMDATKMGFSEQKFDMAVNFLGLEDIHMTRAREGIMKTFLEVNRVLKDEVYFCFTVMPPEEMDTEAQKTEVALFSYICNATWLSTEEYKDMLGDAGFRFIEKKSYHTGKKLSPEQAKKEIKFAIENVPEIYGIDTPSFRDVWGKFGNKIKKSGLGHYSKVVLMIARKK